MKTRFFLIFSSAALVLASACQREEPANPKEETIPETTDRITVLQAGLPEAEAETKTALGTPVGAEYPLVWKKGDAIAVNGVASDPLGSEADGSTSADFTFSGALATPYYGISPASAAKSYSAGTAVIALPEEQTWQNGSYDPAAYILLGSGSATGVQFSVTPMSILKVIPTGEDNSIKITSVEVTSRDGLPMSGSFETDFSSLTASASFKDHVIMTAEDGVALGEPWLLSIPAKTYTNGLKLTITAKNGTAMAMQVKTDYEAKAGVIQKTQLAFKPNVVTATAAEVSSSTVNFTWGILDGVAADIARDWTVQCATDEGFTSGVIEREIPAEGNPWKNLQPKFCFGGLPQNTTYYFRAKQSASGAWSNVVSATTSTYELSTKTTNAAVGDVILAEDFHTAVKGGEGGTHAAAYDGTAYKTFTDSFTQNAAFDGWGIYRPSGSANLYLQQGHVKLGTGSAQSYLVTPELSAIPEGKSATVKVEVTASAYYDDRTRVTAGVVSAEIGTMSSNIFTPSTSAFSNSETFDMTGQNTEWVTYSAVLSGVTATTRLMLGAATPEKNNRINISDVKVTVTALENTPAITATRSDLASTKATFTWNQGGTAAEEIAKAYKFGVYRDMSCEDAVLEYATAASDACWDNKIPKYTFAGLEPSTTYYFKVWDTTNSTYSRTIRFTTSDATTPVKMSDVSAASVREAIEGGNSIVVLNEDFSELRWGGDALNMAACLTAPSDKSSFLNAGTAPLKFADSGGNLFTANATALAASRFASWAYYYYPNTASNVWIRPAYVQICNKGDLCYLFTPALDNIPDGYTATVKVQATLSRYPGGPTSAVIGLESGAFTLSGSRITAGVNLDGYQTVSGLAAGKLSTETCTFTGVSKGSRIYVGPPTTKAGDNRVILDAITVTITALTPTE